MAKRAFIVHGWDGYPEEGWFPWLKRQLEVWGFEVVVPLMPDAAHPHIATWVPALAKVVGKPDADTYFIGHSIGCQTIIRYLETLPKSAKVGGAVFVSGFLRHITNLERDADSVAIDNEWATTPLDTDKVKSHLPKSAAIFSTNDPYVSLENRNDFKQKLGSDIITLEGREHFSGSGGVTQLPEVLDMIIWLSQAE